MSQADRTDDLILAALANPNGRYKGKTLLEYCFWKMDIKQTFRHFSKENRAEFFELFHMLLEDGANVGAWVRRHTDDFVYLQRVTAECLRVFSALLFSDQTAYFLKAQSRWHDFIETNAAVAELLEKEGLTSCEDFSPQGGEEAHFARSLAEIRSGLPLLMSKTKSWEVACAFEECMRGVWRLKTQPWLDEMFALLQIGADTSLFVEEKFSPFFTVEGLLETAADGIGLLEAILRSGGAAITEKPALSDGLSQLYALCAACANLRGN